MHIVMNGVNYRSPRPEPHQSFLHAVISGVVVTGFAVIVAAWCGALV